MDNPIYQRLTSRILIPPKRISKVQWKMERYQDQCRKNRIATLFDGVNIREVPLIPSQTIPYIKGKTVF